jgi:hypothetical protein
MLPGDSARPEKSGRGVCAIAEDMRSTRQSVVANAYSEIKKVPGPTIADCRDPLSTVTGLGF